MARQGGYTAGLDTPRTALGDATYLSQSQNKPDFDMSLEASFHSPQKNADNLLHQLRAGQRPGLRTPRGGASRPPFGDRRNLPAGLGGAEFTPLLKSATRNSAFRHGKENGGGAALTTPGYLGKIDEDMTPVPAGESSVYIGSRNTSGLADATPLPVAMDDSDSIASTPLIMRRRGGGQHDGGKPGPLDDGNQLSLREQENVIDRIEKENFGLKLKIHFLEDALRKAGPGFSEAALRENTELKVDKVTMQRELLRYKKHLNSAERDLESYRVQIEEQAKRKSASEAHKAEVERLRRELEERDGRIGELRGRLEAQEGGDGDGDVEKLQDEVADLEAEVRQKDLAIGQHDDELDEMREKLERAEDEAKDSRDRAEELERRARKSAELEEEVDELKLKLEQADDEAKDSQRRIIELEQKASRSDELDEAKDTIEDLEATVRRLEEQVDDLKEKLDDAVSEKNRAEGDLEELQEEMADKSMVTKGLSRQVEEKITRLQNDLEKSRQEYAALEKENESGRRDNEELKAKMKEVRQDYLELQRELERYHKENGELSSKTKSLHTLQKELDSSHRELEDLKSKMKDLRQERESSERIRQSLASKLEEAQADLRSRDDEKDLLQNRHDALTEESATLQRDLGRLQKTVKQLEDSLEQERQHALDIERDIRAQYKEEIDRLNEEISDLQADVRERENLYDNDSEKWETERHNLESERNRAEERADGLQKTIDKLREVEGSLSNKESKMQEALQMENDRHKKEEAVLSRQIDELQQNLEARQGMLEDLRNELSTVRDELRQTQLDYRSQTDKVAALEDEVEVLQATIDEESEKANSELEQARRKTAILEEELHTLRSAADSARGSASASQAAAQNTTESLARLKFQLADATDALTRVTKERQALQDQVAATNTELHALRTSLSSAVAERDELESALRRAKSHDEDTFRLDQERIDLRTSKTRLENEMRRLQADNMTLTASRSALERSLEREMQKAAAEEEGLNREILALQQKSRGHVVGGADPGSQEELATSRRTVRELERRVEEYETRLAELQAAVPPPEYAGEGSSELSLVRSDLHAARQKELDLLQREAGHKETVRHLKRQVGDLERLLHEAELAAFDSSASSAGGSAQKKEVSELRRQLYDAHAAAAELRKALREAERKATAMQVELEAQLQLLEEEKAAAEQALDDAREGAARQEERLEKYRGKLERYKRERDELAGQMHGGEQTVHSDLGVEERRDLHAMLRESQMECDKLDREAKEQREALEELVSNESRLRAKLERARDERAGYRATAEKLARDVERMQKAASEVRERGWEVARQRVVGGGQDDVTVDTDAIIRAAEAAEKRHHLELRGMCMQVEFMRAKWEKENRLRVDAAYAKKYLLLQLAVRDACNKADLVILKDISAQLKKSRPTIAQSLGRLSLTQAPPANHDRAALVRNDKIAAKRPDRPLKRVITAVRFVVRMQMAAKDWAKHEAVGKKLADAMEEMKRQERMKKMRTEWKAQMANKCGGEVRA